LSDVKWDGDYITLEDGVSYGFFCLKAIDSNENGFAWNRVSLECILPEDSMLRVSAYTSDSRIFAGDPDLDEYLSKQEGAQARSVLSGIFSLVGSGDDFNISRHGRYLWLMLELIASGAAPKLNGIRVSISGDHMIDYLPEIYRKEGAFTKQFLSVFDSLFIDMERAINDLPSRLDFEGTDNEMQRLLAQWVCIEPADLERAALIERISSAVEDYESMYTVRGISRSIERLCSKQPIIIESADVDPNKPGCIHSGLYRKLYGENPYKFFILLEEDSFVNRAEAEKFIRDMRLLIPAHTEFELVLLQRCVRLDRHTYLGVNSFVSNYFPVIIDENTTINYDSTIGGQKIEGQ